MPTPSTSSATQATGRDTSSSNGKVFAKASKEWTIPPRPRPGRKAAEPAATAAPKAGKGAQNRDAQRAFRERKQDYVAELEAKIKEYENQEIQKAITLQNISIALKNENASLKADNDRLRTLVQQLGGDSNPSPQDDNFSDASGSTSTSRRSKKKRPRDPSSSAPAAVATAPGSRGGSRRGSTEPTGRPTQRDASSHPVPIPTAGSPSTVLGSSYGSSPSSPGYRSIQDLLNLPGPTMSAPPGPGSPPIALSNNGPLSPPVWTPYQTPYQIHPPPFAYHRTSPSILSGPGFDVTSLPSAASLKASSTRTTAEDIEIDCGFCTQSDTCVCRMIKEDASLGGGSSSSNSTSTLREAMVVDVKPAVEGIDRPQPAAAAASAGGEGAVKLLRRRPKTTTTPSIWAVAPAPALPECTGDPSNCPACADDPFGKAFCEELGTEPPAEAEVAQHLEQQVKRELNDDGSGDVTMTVSCCGAPEACGSHVHACSTPGASPDSPKQLTLGVEHEHHAGKTVPVADAWRQFKSHPNASFADLSLLAEVVSGRLAAVPSSPDGSHSDPMSPSHASAALPFDAPPPAKRRRLELDAAHVQEALRMLDARSAHGGGGGGGRGGDGVRETAVRRSHLTRRLSDLRGSLDSLQQQATADGVDGAAAAASVVGASAVGLGLH